MIIIGKTISFAGNPKINAMRITPSRPINFANGSRKFDTCNNKLMLLICMFANSQMINPAGAATETALPKIYIVLSKSDLTKILDN